MKIKNTYFLIFIVALLVLTLFNHSCIKNTSDLDNDKSNCDPSQFIDTTRSYFYYYSGGKIYLTLASDIFYTMYDSSVSIEAAEYNQSDYDIIKIGKFSRTNSYLLKPPEGKRAEEFFTFYGFDTDCGFGSQEFVQYSTPVFWFKPGIDSSLTILTDEFLAELDTAVFSFEKINKINKTHHVEFVQTTPVLYNWYLLKVNKNSDLNALDMAILYQDSAYTVLAAPNFHQLLFPL